MNIKPVTVVLADDHKVLREGICALLSADNVIEVISETDDGIKAVELALTHFPDVVILDIALPGISGIEALERIKKAAPNMRILMLSMHNDYITVKRALNAGCNGYLVKGVGISELSNAIKKVAVGGQYFSSEIKGYAKEVSSGLCPFASCLVDPLSNRECEVLQLVAEGYTARQIAKQLNLSPKTVENHRAKIMDRLDIHTIAGLVRYAIKNGIST